MTEERISKVAESHWLAAFNRIVTPILLAVFAFLGLQVWGDLKAQSADIWLIRVNQAATDAKLNDVIRRLDRIEVQGNGSLRFQPTVNNP